MCLDLNSQQIEKLLVSKLQSDLFTTDDIVASCFSKKKENESNLPQQFSDLLLLLFSLRLTEKTKMSFSSPSWSTTCPTQSLCQKKLFPSAKG